VGERNPVWRARSAEESVDLLMSGRCGVLLVDMAAVSAEAPTLVEQIVEQFPDVVVVVAGRREDEATLAKLISDGLVYRFMHKPLSEKRAGMFLNAAVRAHAERMQGRITEPLLPVMGEIGSRMDFRKWAFVTLGLALFLAALAILLVSLDEARNPAPPPVARTADRPAPQPATVPLADPVLSRARAAFAAGRLESPAGRNALDLYSAVLLARPDNPEARDGLAETKRRLVAAATDAATAGNAAEARRLAARVLGVDPGDAEARALIRRLEMPTGAVRTPPPILEGPVAVSTSAAATDAGPYGSTATPAGPGAAPSLPPDRLSRVPVTRIETNAGSVTPPVVRADPLTPRLLPSGPSMRVTVPARASGDAPAVPAGPEHAIAGYVKDAQSRPEPATDVAAPAGVERRDLEQVVRIEPVYPPEAFRNGVGGWVDVDFTVTERGTTRDIRVVASDPRAVFDEAAIAAVAQWQYRPRVVNGRAVPQRSSVTLRFEVDR
jgi:protein TonB